MNRSYYIQQPNKKLKSIHSSHHSEINFFIFEQSALYPMFIHNKSQLSLITIMFNELILLRHDLNTDRHVYKDTHNKQPNGKIVISNLYNNNMY